METIYLDNCATTPCAQETVSIMNYYLTTEFANPASLHTMGKRAKYAIDHAAKQVARLINAESAADIVFTSGATESNHIAILGNIAQTMQSPEHIILSPIDHKSIVNIGMELERRGILVKYLPVDASGIIDIDFLTSNVNAHTKLVAITQVNSELGTIQPLAKIAAICQEKNVHLHVDAAQGASRLPIDVMAMQLSSVSLSAHKMYGPKGVGALYVNPIKRKNLRPLTYGGEQNSLRSGTLPTHLIVGMGMASERAQQSIITGYAKAERLRNVFLKNIQKKISTIIINNNPEVCVPHIINLQVPNIATEALVSGMQNVAISSGSACNSANLAPSYVLLGIGLSSAQANASFRICLDSNLTLSQLQTAIETITEKIRDLT